MPSCAAANAIAGVGTTPSRAAGTCSSARPAMSSPSMRAPDSRVSRPISTRSGARTRAMARPNATTRGVVRSTEASPRTPSVPNCSTAEGLALRVLRRLARLLEAVLAALLLARVAHEQPSLLQHRAGIAVERHERTGDTQPDRTGLTANTATRERGVDVVHLFGLRQAQRFFRDDLVREDREVLLELATV